MSWQEGGWGPRVKLLHKFFLHMGTGRRVDVSYRKRIDAVTGVTKERELFLGPLRLIMEGSLREFGRDVIKVFLGRLKPSEAVSVALSLMINGGKEREELDGFVAGLVEGMVAAQFGSEAVVDGGVGLRLLELQGEEVVGVARRLCMSDSTKMTALDLARVMVGCGFNKDRIQKEMEIFVDGRSAKVAAKVVKVGV